ncbi:class I SAM-dependent methyltransferase [Chloroflexota bacterium]
MSSRQDREAHFHDTLRGYLKRKGSSECAKYAGSNKWYSITRSSRGFVERFVEQRCRNKLVLDYGCGAGASSIWLAKMGAIVTGIDISKVSIDLCNELAERENVNDRTSFLVADAEALDFPDNHFDIVWCGAILHHLDIQKAYREIVRLLKPEGVAVCQEALGHNPLINFYRRRTPYLRSEDEHPLLRPEVDMAKEYFREVDRRFFHLTTLAGVPLRRWPAFSVLLTLLEAVDSVLLRLPWVKWQAWQVVLLLHQPNKAIL